ncbi:hypothetical protein D9M71_399860 [compost metagenome]
MACSTLPAGGAARCTEATSSIAASATSGSGSTSSPSPSSTAATSAGRASAAICGSAKNSSPWPRRAPRLSSLLRLRIDTGALSLPAMRTRSSPVKFFARLMRTCAGRACRPWGLASVTCALGQSTGSSPPSASSTARTEVADASSPPRPSTSRSPRRSSTPRCASPWLARQNSPRTVAPACATSRAGVTKASPGRSTLSPLCSHHRPWPSGSAWSCGRVAVKPVSTQPSFFSRRVACSTSSSKSSTATPRPTSCASSASGCGAPCSTCSSSSGVRASRRAAPASASPRVRVSSCSRRRCSSDFAAMPIARCTVWPSPQCTPSGKCSRRTPVRSTSSRVSGVPWGIAMPWPR